MVDPIVAEEPARSNSPWFESFIEQDPRSAIVALDVPVLALSREPDTQVSAPADSIAMSEAIGTSSIPGYTIATITSANHLFQEAVTGGANEYVRLKRQFAGHERVAASPELRCQRVRQAGRQFAPDFVAILTEWLAESFASG